MPVVVWLTHLVGATLWFALHLGIAAGFYLLSAHLATLPGEDERVGAIVFRVLASFWFYIAAWFWIVRGVLQRPPKPAEKRKPTGAEAARGLAGCLANLVPIPILYLQAGGLADWAWGGIMGSEPAHPARRFTDQLLASAFYALDHAGSWVPWTIAGLVLLNVAKRVFTGTTRRRSASRPGVSDANQATLEKLRRNKGKTPRPPAPQGREILAAAGAASADRVRAAHAGAHGAESRTSSSSAREDRVLGTLSYSSSDGAWWARRDEGFPVLIEGDAGGADTSALEVARNLVPRSFEALLRASDVARPAAQQRGVGLPRFTIAAVRIAAGTPPAVTLHLRSDGDSGHEYVVVSTDSLRTFRLQ